MSIIGFFLQIRLFRSLEKLGHFSTNSSLVYHINDWEACRKLPYPNHHLGSAHMHIHMNSDLREHLHQGINAELLNLPLKKVV